MTERDHQDATGVLNAFLHRYLEDESSGSVKPLDAYQRQFPGYEELIARKYSELGARGDDAGATTTRELFDSHLDLPRERIGPYKLLQSLGEGGMGTVYLAEQTEPIRRRVALKRIKLGMDTQEVIGRFEAERQALALMNHPAIARVFDAGSTPDGRPYFVMEYVPGQPITKFSDTHKLDIRERLELFIQLTEAVQHAHQKGIIHRDIKPSNVLVTLEENRPVPKIIDFGIAKSLSQPLTDRTAYTQQGQLIGTPAYVSPEQADVGSLDVDTRTDIYSLGVLLYELVVGALPLDVRQLGGLGYAELQRRIVEEEPPKPSTRFTKLGGESQVVASRRRTDVRSLAKELRGDLDWIVMKALEKDRTRRYASASEFGADVRRHLAHEPVLARPPSIAYRAGKLMRRHRVGLSATLVAVVLIAAIALVMSYAEHRRRIAASEEQLEAARSSLNEYRQSKRQLAEIEERWEAERNRLPTWAPVWMREKELLYWDELQSEERQAARSYNDALVSLYNAFRSAPLGSAERLDAQREVFTSVWPIHREESLGREEVLGPAFLSVLFESAAGRVEAVRDAAYRLRIASRPSGAEIHCFRYELVEGRRFPLPFDTESGIVSGEPFLEVGSLWPEEVEGRGDGAPFETGDRLLSVGGEPVRVLRDLVASLRKVERSQAVRVTVERSGAEKSILWVPFRDRKPASIDSLRKRFGFEPAGYPLDIGTSSLAGRTPAELFLPEGSYLLVLRHAGHEDTRFPVSTPLLPAVEGKVQEVRLPGGEDVPPGFVHVPAGIFTCGGDPEADQALEFAHVLLDDFFIGRYEVTVAEYIAFLDALGDAVDDEGMAAPSDPFVRDVLEERGRELVDLIPRSYPAGKPLLERSSPGWTLRDPGEFEDAEKQPLREGRQPILGTTLLAATEYARWRSREDPDWNYRIPTDLEWEKAARGVDRRLFVWGDYAVWSFCMSVKGTAERNALPAPVGAYPLDESVYGVRDLAGSVSEVTTGITEPPFRSLRGGNWYSVLGDYIFHIANRNGRPAHTARGIDTGIRLIAERAPRQGPGD